MRLWRVIILILALHGQAHAQLWSSILDDTRGADWTTAGVQGGIPSGSWTQCGSTITAYTGTAGTINTAISSCGANQYVLLGAGSFTLSSGITFNGKTNVELRGAGADQTTLTFTNTSSCNGFGAEICISSAYLEMNDATPGDNRGNWTAGLAKGSTTITLSSVTGLNAGDLVILSQNNDASDPGTDLEFICSVTGTCSNGSFGGGGCTTLCSPRREQLQIAIVSSITGTDVTLADPILANNWQSGLSPTAAWLNAAPISNVGLKNFAIVHDTGSRGIEIMYAKNIWVQGIKSKNSGRHHVDLFECVHCEVRDSYFYEGQSHSSQSYGIECMMCSHAKIENNIVTNVTAPFMFAASGTGSVIGYNYSKDMTYTVATWQQIDHYYHATGSSHNLHEGNIGVGLISDNVHGPSHHITAYRNYFRGRDDDCAGSACTAQTNPIHIYSQSRFFNVIGNILGDNAYHTKYESYTGNTTNCYTSIYQFDFSGNNCNSDTYSSDSSVRTGAYRWGNYDTVNDGSRFVSGEVPTAIAGTYDQAEPGSQTLPDSLYLSSVPSWYGYAGTAIDWPSIGPDVTGGDLANLGGHVYSNPAKTCYDNATFSGAEITDFNAGVCYATVAGGSSSGGSMDVKVPDAPAMLTVQK